MEKTQLLLEDSTKVDHNAITSEAATNSEATTTEATTTKAAPLHFLEGAGDLPCFFRDVVDHKVKLEIFKDSPYLCLLRAPLQKRSMPVWKHLLSSYDPEKKAFFIHGKCMKICVEEAGFILGLKNEGIDSIQTDSHMTQIPEYYMNILGKLASSKGNEAKLLKSPLSKTTIESVLQYMKIDQENSLVFKKIMYVFLYRFVFNTTTMKKASASDFSVVEDIDLFEKVNWVRLMFSKLEGDLSKGHAFMMKPSGKLNLSSFSYLLEAWYYLRTDCSADKMLNEMPEKAPIEYYTSDNRVHKVQENLKDVQFKRRCRMCEAEELKLEEEKKLESAAPNSKAVAELAPPPRTFRIQTDGNGIEMITHQLTEEIGEQLLEVCLKSLMTHASTLGIHVSTTDELLDMMVEHLKSDNCDSWCLVDLFLSYKAQEKEEGQEVTDEPQPISALKPDAELSVHGSTGGVSGAVELCQLTDELILPDDLAATLPKEPNAEELPTELSQDQGGNLEDSKSQETGAVDGVPQLEPENVEKEKPPKRKAATKLSNKLNRLGHGQDNLVDRRLRRRV